jgi:hypothetical protein
MKAGAFFMLGDWGVQITKYSTFSCGTGVLARYILVAGWMRRTTRWINLFLEIFLGD